MRAKFRLTGIEVQGPVGRKVTLKAEYDTTIPEDQRFYDATPWGEFAMLVNNPAALEQLKLGEYYYLDLMPCANSP